MTMSHTSYLSNDGLLCEMSYKLNMCNIFSLLKTKFFGAGTVAQHGEPLLIDTRILRWSTTSVLAAPFLIQLSNTPGKAEDPGTRLLPLLLETQMEFQVAAFVPDQPLWSCAAWTSGWKILRSYSAFQIDKSSQVNKAKLFKIWNKQSLYFSNRATMRFISS